MRSDYFSVGTEVAVPRSWHCRCNGARYLRNNVLPGMPKQPRKFSLAYYYCSDITMMTATSWYHPGATRPGSAETPHHHAAPGIIMLPWHCRSATSTADDNSGMRCRDGHNSPVLQTKPLTPPPPIPLRALVLAMDRSGLRATTWE